MLWISCSHFYPGHDVMLGGVYVLPCPLISPEIKAHPWLPVHVHLSICAPCLAPSSQAQGQKQPLIASQCWDGRSAGCVPLRQVLTGSWILLSWDVSLGCSCRRTRLFLECTVLAVPLTLSTETICLSCNSGHHITWVWHLPGRGQQG